METLYSEIFSYNTNISLIVRHWKLFLTEIGEFLVGLKRTETEKD